MIKRLIIIIGVILICIQTSMYGENIRFSGILGQSQSRESIGLPFITSIGVVYDVKTHQLWTGSQNRLYALVQKDGTWQCKYKIALTSPIYSKFSLLYDGEKIYFVGQDHMLYAVNPTSRQVTQLFRIKKGVISLTVAPKSLRNGFAEQAKWFLLYADEVMGKTNDDSKLKLILELTKKNVRKWKYRSIGIDPLNGDLLVGSHYPHMTVYRYNNIQGAVNSSVWPRIAHSRFIQTARNSVWAVDGKADLMSMKKHQKGIPDVIGPYWSTSSSGIACLENENILSTSQGLIRFNRYGDPLRLRVGGLSGVCGMAIADDGTVVVAIDDGRMIRLAIDDNPDQAFLCNGNEPFRMGANWSSRCIDIEYDGTQFIALDHIKKKVWSFNPQLAAVWREKPWVELTESGYFNNPQSIAVGDQLYWVLDGDQIVELSFHKTPRSKRIISLDAKEIQDITGIQSDKLLLVSEKNQIKAFKRSKEGVFQKLWENKPENFQISELVASEQYTVAFDRNNQEILILNTESGDQLYKSEKNIFLDSSVQMTTIALHNRWILVFDDKNHWIIRLAISL